jgi:hypothetical protein
MPTARRSLKFVGGQAQASGATSVSAVTSAVSTSFAFGWQMARLYTGPLGSAAELRPERDLPGLSGLPAPQLVQLGLGQANVALSQLKAFIGDAQLPTTDGVRAAMETRLPNQDTTRKAILDLHVALLIQLTAADYRLGKAYGLGRALADTCATAHGDETERRRALEHHLEPHRALVMAGWLDDLKTVLPAHASQGVADSLERWTLWAETADLTTLDPRAVNDTTRVLHRCGQRWRAILSGEKDAQDLLKTSDYVSAARCTLAQVGAIARSLAWQLRGPLAVAAVLIGVGIWLIVANHSTAQVLAGLGTIAGGLGITWRSAAGALGHLSLDLVRPLWEAQNDLAVATRLTPLPQRDYVPQLERPRSRVGRAWRELRTADPDAPRGVPAKQDRSRPPDTTIAAHEQGDKDAVVLDADPSRQADDKDESDTRT